MIYVYESLYDDDKVCADWKSSDNPIFISNCNVQLTVPNGKGKLYNVFVQYFNSKSFVIIDGKFKNGEIKYGKMSNTSHIIYEGPFKNNVPNGVGMIFSYFNFENTRFYGNFYGNIKNFTAHGIGKIYDIKNNFMMEVLCEYGVIIRKIEKDEILNNARLLLNLSIS